MFVIDYMYYFCWILLIIETDKLEKDWSVWFWHGRYCDKSQQHTIEKTRLYEMLFQSISVQAALCSMFTSSEVLYYQLVIILRISFSPTFRDWQWSLLTPSSGHSLSNYEWHLTGLPFHLCVNQWLPWQQRWLCKHLHGEFSDIYPNRACR